MFSTLGEPGFSVSDYASLTGFSVIYASLSDLTEWLVETLGTMFAMSHHSKFSLIVQQYKTTNTALNDAEVKKTSK